MMSTRVVLCNAGIDSQTCCHDHLLRLLAATAGSFDMGKAVSLVVSTPNEEDLLTGLRLAVGRVPQSYKWYTKVFRAYASSYPLYITREDARVMITLIAFTTVLLRKSGKSLPPEVLKLCQEILYDNRRGKSVAAVMASISRVRLKVGGYVPTVVR